jgi:regulator of RNase E activity RraA
VTDEVVSGLAGRDTSHVPVAIGGVLVSPGGMLLGDADGLVAVPSARAVGYHDLQHRA